MKLREPSCDCEHDRPAQRTAKREENLFGVMERNAQLEEENARLQDEVARLQGVAQLERQLALAHKVSSTSSKPPSSDVVKPKKPLPKGGTKRKKVDNRDATGERAPEPGGEGAGQLGACLAVRRRVRR